MPVHCWFRSVVQPAPMRLSKLQTGHGIRQKFLLRLTHVLTWSEPFDVVKAFTYRPEYFGKHFCDLGMISYVVLQNGPSANENCLAHSQPV